MGLMGLFFVFFYTAAFSGDGKNLDYDVDALWCYHYAISHCKAAITHLYQTSNRKFQDKPGRKSCERSQFIASTAEGNYIPGAWKNICIPESSHRRNYCT